MTQRNIGKYLEQIVQFENGRMSPMHYIWKKGRSFDSKELTDVEREYVKRISRGEYPIKQCYRNSQIVALTARLSPETDLRYVEGYVDCGVGIPLSHAWLSVNGKVVDLTIRVDGQKYKRVHGIMPDDYEYYGVEMNPRECKHCMEHGTHISLIDDWECGWPKLRKVEGVIE